MKKILLISVVEIMPELPEVETVKNGIAQFAGNARILEVTVRNRRLRTDIPDGFESALRGASICRYRRKGKYLIIDLNNNYSIIWHLGMSGRVKTMTDKPLPEKHDHVIFETSAGWLVFNDPRRFGLIYACPSDKTDRQPCLAAMGPDPFDEKLTAQYLLEHLQKRKNAIKPTLLDQKLIAGIGNIYASEILFAAGINPQRPACSLNDRECQKLVSAIRCVLKQAIDNGGSTLHDYHKPDGSLGYFQNLHCVYNKSGQRCPNCTCNPENGEGIRKIVQDGRSTFFCPVKQK